MLTMLTSRLSVKTLVLFANRSKPDWHIKMKDDAIRAKWTEEALTAGGRLKREHVKYVLDELEWYARAREEKTGIQVISTPTSLQPQLPVHLSVQVTGGPSTRETCDVE